MELQFIYNIMYAIVYNGTLTKLNTDEFGYVWMLCVCMEKNKIK